jgi:transposase
MNASLPQSAGIDISKDWLDVHVHPDGSYKRFANEAAGHKALFKWPGGWSIERIANEATGACHRAFEQAGRALPLVKLNPRRARRFAEATGTLAKTDRVDAAMLARMAAMLKPDRGARRSRERSHGAGQPRQKPHAAHAQETK